MLSTIEILFIEIGRIGDVVMEVDIVGFEIHYFRSHRRTDQSMSFSIIFIMYAQRLSASASPVSTFCPLHRWH
jgi:hypothetical protein